MPQIIGYLILCPLAFLMGWVACWDRIAKQEQREYPLREAIIRYQLDEAYRAGQKNPDPLMRMDAPVPSLQDGAEDSAMYRTRCSLEPLFPDADKAQGVLKHRGRISAKRINGIWNRA